MKHKLTFSTAAINTEALRLARGIIKDIMKEKGIKVSWVRASKITLAAKALLRKEPSIRERAKANLTCTERLLERRNRP